MAIENFKRNWPIGLLGITLYVIGGALLITSGGNVAGLVEFSKFEKYGLPLFTVGLTLFIYYLVKV